MAVRDKDKGSELKLPHHLALTVCEMLCDWDDMKHSDYDGDFVVEKILPEARKAVAANKRP